MVTELMTMPAKVNAAAKPEKAVTVPAMAPAIMALVPKTEPEHVPKLKQQTDAAIEAVNRSPDKKFS
jgi:hypothetical protein